MTDVSMTAGRVKLENEWVPVRFARLSSRENTFEATNDILYVCFALVIFFDILLDQIADVQSVRRRVEVQSLVLRP